MKKLIQRYELKAEVQGLRDTDEMILTRRIASIFTALHQRKEPPQTWYDKRGRRWEIWDLETAADWIDRKRRRWVL